MNMDTLMAVAFGLFVVLLVWRMRERFLEGKKKQNKTGSANRLRFKHLFYHDDEKIKTSRMRRLFLMLMLVVLGGGIVYMIFVSINDFSVFHEKTIFFRCFLFVLAIFSFIRLLYVLKGSNKGG